MGRISDALARAEGRSRPVSAPPEEPLVPWTFDAPEAAEPAATADDRESFLPERAAAAAAARVAAAPIAAVPAVAAPAVAVPAPAAAAVAVPAAAAVAVNGAAPASKVFSHTPQRPRVLGTIPPAIAERLVTAPTLPSPVKEQYRRLAATLHHAQREEGVRVLMVASALPNEGKTLVTGNLALTLSRSFGRRVLMIDGDLRKPSLNTLFGVADHEPGLTDYLTSGPAGTVAPIAITNKLSFVPAGQRHGDSMRVVTGGIMQRVIQEAADAYDWVILDTPPIGLLADAHVLAAMADRVLVVIDAGKTPYDLIQRSVEVLGKERIIGTVLNRAERSQVSPSGYDYDNYYDSDAPASGK